MLKIFPFEEFAMENSTDCDSSAFDLSKLLFAYEKLSRYHASNVWMAHMSRYMRHSILHSDDDDMDASIN